MMRTHASCIPANHCVLKIVLCVYHAPRLSTCIANTPQCPIIIGGIMCSLYKVRLITHKVEELAAVLQSDHRLGVAWGSEEGGTLAVG